MRTLMRMAMWNSSLFFRVQKKRGKNITVRVIDLPEGDSETWSCLNLVWEQQVAILTAKGRVLTSQSFLTPPRTALLTRKWVTRVADVGWVGPVGARLAYLVPTAHVTQGEPGGEPHPRSPILTRAQGGVILGLEQGEPGADFTPLGHPERKVPTSWLEGLNPLLGIAADHLWPWNYLTGNLVCRTGMSLMEFVHGAA